MARIDPERLYNVNADLSIYDDVPLDPKGGPCLLFPGEFPAVICFGQEKDEEDGLYWLLKVGLTLPGERGQPAVKGHWWIRVYQKHAGRWANFFSILPIDPTPREYQPEEFVGCGFMIRIGYSRDETAGRLWPQRFSALPAQSPRAAAPQGRGGRPAPRQAQQQQQSFAADIQQSFAADMGMNEEDLPF